MADQVQESQQPQQPVSKPLLSDGPGVSHSTATDQLSKSIAGLEARRRAITDQARKSLMADFRQAQGLPEPTPVVQPAPVVAPVVAPEPAQGNPNAIAQAFTQQLQSQFAEAQRIQAEALAKAQASDTARQAAEAKLSQFLQNPASYLQDQKLTIDEWNKRLVNGGQPTETERLRDQIRAELKAEMAPALQQVSHVKQVMEAQMQQAAVAELTPVLAKEYPMLDALLGPAGTMDALRAEAQRTGKQVNAKAWLDAQEASFLTKQQAVLRREAVATKLGVSVKSPQAVVADQSPQTLTNRVTSTVSPQPSRPMTEAERIARGREMAKKLFAAG